MVRSHKDIAKYACNIEEKEPNCEVLLRIGRDCGAAMSTVCHGAREPWVHETPLGWALVGDTCTVSSGSKQVHVVKTDISHEHFSIKNNFSVKQSYFNESNVFVSMVRQSSDLR